MASTSPTLLAHRAYPVQLKINYEGVVRRIKMPLCDLSPTSLELKVRTDLEIPAEVPCTIERYSDSAARYITLDRDDLSVYKQLYRAAKSKKKLKLRVRAGIPGSVSSTDPPTPSHASPSPDHKSDDVPLDETNKPNKKPCKLDSLSTTAKQSSPPYSLSALSPGEGFQESLAKMMREQLNIEQDIEALEATLAAALHTDATGAPPPPGFKPSSEKEKDVSGRKTPVLVLRQPTEHSLALKAEAEQASTESFMTTSASPLVNTSDATDVVLSNYTVCCNSCDRTISAAHYHCSTCDDGDFDLCTACVDAGITCHGADSHWLIKRFIQNGNIINSTTKRITPQHKAASVVAPPLLLSHNMRTCNACIDELPETEFLHCTDCEDFDLCRKCFVKDRHGHHPGHAFQPLVDHSLLTTEKIKRRLPPGRGQAHSAICDGCDEDIVGIRHKCLDCPDWDYCTACMETSSLAHPGHRFARLYEPVVVSDAARVLSCLQPTHHGVRCDGPHCKTRGFQLFIRGDRYKCAVCHDTDFCARCEASPENSHNKSHPLIKFKTPIRSVTVFTTEQGIKGKPTRLMGDRCAPTPSTTTMEEEDDKPIRSSADSFLSTSTRCCLREFTSSQPAAELPNIAGKESPVTSSLAPSEEQLTQSDTAAAAPTPSENGGSAANIDRHDQEGDLLDATATAQDKETEAQSSLAELENLYPPVKTATCVDQALVYNDLTAAFVRESVTDGTVMPPNHLFEQTWVLRNDGVTTWPAGCVVKFVGGDYMGQIDPNHPADICSLNSAFCSNPSHVPVAPRQRYAFTVPMRTPPREGTFISYWRLTMPNGHKFGHRLWCDVRVRTPPSHDDEVVKNAPQGIGEKDAALIDEVVLGKTEVDERDADNSPTATAVALDERHSEVKPVEPEPPVAVAEAEASSPLATLSSTEAAKADEEEFDQCEEIDAWAEDGSGDEFLTDEEYDILDASDEEFNDQLK